MTNNKKNNRRCDAARGCRPPLHLLHAQEGEAAGAASAGTGRTAADGWAEQAAEGEGGGQLALLVLIVQRILLVQEVTLGRGQTLPDEAARDLTVKHEHEHAVDIFGYYENIMNIL